MPDPTIGKFVRHTVASGLPRGAAHTIKLQAWFFDGVDNDHVKVCVDGSTCETVGSWEDFFREQEAREPSPVDSVLFHTRSSGGTCVSCSGNGFFIDNFVAKTQNYNGANVKLTGPNEVLEGNAGATQALYTLTLSEPLPFSVTVPYHTNNGSAAAGSDYVDNDNSVTFAPGETVKQVAVDINGDTTDETHESFTFAIDTPTFESRSAGDASDQFVFRFNNSKVTQIRDDDSTLRISDGPETLEPDGNNVTPMPFTVTLDNPSASTVTVRVRTIVGSAASPGDYTARDITLTFQPGQTTKTVNVNVRADNLVEGEENFLVRLSSPTNASIADNTGIGVIDDADD